MRQGNTEEVLTLQTSDFISICARPSNESRPKLGLTSDFQHCTEAILIVKCISRILPPTMPQLPVGFAPSLGPILPSCQINPCNICVNPAKEYLISSISM